MSTYYDYQKRDLDKSQIDWSGITKKISEDLQSVGQEREEKRQELDKAHISDLNEVNQYEVGLDQSANEFALKSTQATKTLLNENNKMMKAGIRDVADAQLYKQKIKDNWTNLNAALKGYQTTFKNLSESEGKGNMAILEDLAKSLDLQDKVFYQNPETGEGYLAKIDPKTGVMDKKSLQPIRSLVNQQKQAYEYVDVNKRVSEDVKNAEPWKAAISSTQNIEDVRQNPEFSSWKENKIKATLNSDRATSSVLMDYLNYNYTMDPDEVDEKTILFKRDRSGILQPEISPEQKKAAEEAYGNALELALGRKETKTQPRTSSTSTRKPTEKERSARRKASVIDDFVLNGNYSALKSSLTEEGFQNISISDDKSELTLEDEEGNISTVDLSSGDAFRIGQELAGSLGVSDDYNQYATSSGKEINEAVYQGNYGPILRKPVKEVSSDTIEDLNNALDSTLPVFNEEGFTNQMFQQQAKSAITAAFKQSGLDPTKVTVSKTGWVKYDGKNVGSINKANPIDGATVAQFIEEQKTEQATPNKKRVNLNASTRG